MKEIKINVSGMHCEGCEKRIINSLSLLEEVKDVMANHNDGTVVIKIDKEIDLNVIKEQIEDLGFEIKER